MLWSACVAQIIINYSCRFLLPEKCIACIVVGSLFYFDYFVSSLLKSYTFCLSELTMYEF